MLSPQQITQLRTSAGLSPVAPSAGANDIIAQRKAALSAAPTTSSTQPAQQNGVQNLIDIGKGVGSAVAAPLQRLGAVSEMGLDQTLGRVINAATGKGFTPTTSGKEAMKNAEAIDQFTPNTDAGKLGNFVGTIAPYFTGLGEEKAGMQLAAQIPKLAESLGMKAESFIPKLVSYLTEHAPSALKNTAIGTGQTGDIGQGATIGVGGEAVGSALSSASKIADLVGKAGTQTLGFTTGTGASSVSNAFASGVKGGSAFTDALRGKLTPTDILGDAERAVENIANSRRIQYLSDLKNVKSDVTSKDISPVTDALQKQLETFGLKVGQDGKLDFSRSTISPGADANKVQQAFDIVNDWGSKAGDRTAVGLDTLKQKLGNLFNARTDGTPVSAFLTPIKGAVRDVLSKVPGYDQMTGNYMKASNLLDEIKSATGIGGHSNADTVMTKLQTALKGDKDFRLEVLQNMMNASGAKDLEQKIAGLNMTSLMPKGLVGKTADAGAIVAAFSHLINPSSIPLFLSTSPRIVGEVMHGMGIASRYVAPFTKLLEKVTGNPDLMSAIGAELTKNAQTPATPPQSTTPQI